MSAQWAKNLLLAQDLSDEQMNSIPYPRLEMHIHVFYKTVEAGIILGGGIIAPITALIRKKPIGATMFRYARNGALIGAVAGPAMLEMKLRNQSPESIWDRCYRLRHNRNQVRVDRATSYGAVVGATVTIVMGQGILPGVLLGIGLGCLGGGAYNSQQAPKKSKSKPKEDNDEKKKQK